jgi:hypothetical protein
MNTICIYSTRIVGFLGAGIPAWAIKGTMEKILQEDTMTVSNH